METAPPPNGITMLPLQLPDPDKTANLHATETLLSKEDTTASSDPKLPPADYTVLPATPMVLQGEQGVEPAPEKASPTVQCYMLWNNFADYTTLHGFRQIAEDTDYLSRRIFWIIITAFGFGLLMYQTGNSVSLYMARPVAYNVKRNYYNSLEFPAITICNQNVFRITQAWDELLYSFLEKMYDGSSRKSKNVSSLTGIDQSLDRVMDKMKHQKEDLILSCKWNRASTCYVRDLKTTSVDNSICYTFNGDPSNPMKTSLTGSNSGLDILMNIEQYEFMRTRSLTAGIEVYIHNQGDLPREAISIPPGMKAYIRVNTRNVTLLRPPYGVCSSKRLSFFHQYSTAACLLECREKWLMKQCGCHSGALPHMANVSLPVCSISNFSSCIVPKLNGYTPAIGKCSCPTECNFRRYNNFMSFSQISTFDVEQALSHLPTSTQQKLMRAREVFYRVNADKRKVTVNNTLIPFLTVTNHTKYRLDRLLNKVEIVKNRTKELKKEMYYRFRFHKYMLGRMYYSVKNNWKRGWEVARERTFSLVAFDYLPLLYSIDLYAEIHKNPNISRESLSNYQSMIDTRLFEKIQIGERAIINLTEIHEAFANTTRLLKYKTTPLRYYDAEFAPESIIQFNEQFEQSTFNNFINYTKELIENMKKMRGFIREMASDTGHQINNTAYDKARFYIEKRSRSFNYYLYLYEDRIVNQALELMQTRVTSFSAKNHSMSETFSKLTYKLQNLHSILKNLQIIYDKSGAVIVDLATKYLNQNHSLTYNLTQISQFTLSSDGKQLESFVSGLDSIEVYRLTLEQDMWMLQMALTETISAVWDDSVERPYKKYARDLQALCLLNASEKEKLNITEEELAKVHNLTDVNITNINTMRRSVFEMAKQSRGKAVCPQVLKLTNTDWMLVGEDKIVKAFKDEMKEMRKAVSLITDVTQQKEKLGMNVMNLKSYAINFREGNEISRKFVKDNFVQVQIYFQDLVSVDESQTPAYTMTQLWSDFGGNFGLLLGASALSVIEIVDFFIHESLKMRR